MMRSLLRRQLLFSSSVDIPPLFAALSANSLSCFSMDQASRTRGQLPFYQPVSASRLKNCLRQFHSVQHGAETGDFFALAIVGSCSRRLACEGIGLPPGFARLKNAAFNAI